MRRAPAALWLGLLVCRSLSLGAGLLACTAEAPLISSNAKERAETDAGTADDTEPEPSGTVGVDASVTLNPRPALDPGSPSCAPEAGRCAAFGSERPNRTSEHSAVYDPERRQMIVFGGTPSIPVNCGPGPVEFVDELWLYDDPCGRWSQLVNSGPSARGRHMAAFGDGRMFVFGGRFRQGSSGPYVLFDELWSFDTESHGWRELGDGNPRPTARVSGALLYDAMRERLWLMGGNQSEDGAAYLPTNDVWSYALAGDSWQQHNTSIGPEPRLFHTALLDPKRDRLVIFGGADETAFSGSAQYFGDIWALDLEALTWERLAAQNAGPRGRFWSSMVYASDNDSYLVFGGHDDAVLGNRNDSWSFDPEARAWTALGSEDTHQNDANGVCNFPPDFAAIDPLSPERRNAHTLIWSEPCHHALLFAGKTDCGSADDVWRWSPEREWTPRMLAREGEACLRWRDDISQCTDICF